VSRDVKGKRGASLSNSFFSKKIGGSGGFVGKGQRNYRITGGVLRRRRRECLPMQGGKAGLPPLRPRIAPEKGIN